jgi:hypothetical protein
MKSKERALLRRTITLAIAALAVCALTSVGVPGGVLSANAEACITGEQPRTLPTDSPGYSETQFCLSGEWTTTSYFSTKPDYLKIDETVEDPKAPQYGLNVSDFFDLKKVDPFAIINVFRDLADGATTLPDADKLKEKLDLAQQKAQALLNRQNTSLNDGCRMRSVTYSRGELTLGYGWLGPVSTAPVGQPSQITYAFAAGFPDDMKVTVLNALEQYPNAVRYQDASFQYPEQIVPHDPSDTRPPTITFFPQSAADVGDGLRLGGTTTPTSVSGNLLMGPLRWVSGRVGIVQGGDTPLTVGHEIGHVLGLNHTDDQTSTMYPVAPSLGHDGSPWTPSLDMDGLQDQAFSGCMFLPPVTPY